MKRGFWFNQGPAVLWTVLIFVLSSFSTLQAPELGFNLQDKLYHFLFYGVYGVFLARAFRRQNWSVEIQKKYLLSAIVFGIVFAASDEWHQHFVPGRYMEFWDFVADAMGVAAGAWGYRMWPGIEIFRKHVQKYFILR